MAPRQRSRTSVDEWSSGEFFQTLPKVLKTCSTTRLQDLTSRDSKQVGDWDNDAATRILNKVRSAAPDHARLLIIDSVVPAGNSLHPSKAIDLVMLSLVNGRERNEGEWRQLLEGGGFQPVNIADGLIQAAPN